MGDGSHGRTDAERSNSKQKNACRKPVCREQNWLHKRQSSPRQSITTNLASPRARFTPSTGIWFLKCCPHAEVMAAWTVRYAVIVEVRGCIYQSE